MRKLYLFEIEANEKPVLSIGEWENSDNLTSDINLAQERNAAAYGEIEDGNYIELYEKKVN